MDTIFNLSKAKAEYTGFEFFAHFWSAYYFTGFDLEISVNVLDFIIWALCDGYSALY